MAVALLDDSGVVEATDPAMPSTIYTLDQPANSTGCVVVALLTLSAVDTSEPLDLATLAFTFAGNAPDATDIIGGQQGDLPIALAYAYWIVPADTAVSGAVAFTVTDIDSQSKLYRGYVTAFSGVDSVSGAELSSGIDQELNAGFAAPGELPEGSAALLMSMVSPDVSGLAATETLTTGLVGQPSFIAYFAEGAEAELDVDFSLNTGA